VSWEITEINGKEYTGKRELMYHFEPEEFFNPHGDSVSHEVLISDPDSDRIIRARVECKYFSGVSRDYGDVKKIRYEPRCPRGCRKDFDKMIEDALHVADLIGVWGPF
jgi:hypothetical protein